MRPDIESVTRQFQIPGRLAGVRPLGSGHINDTFAVTFERDRAPATYVFQRINRQVFRYPVAMMENIARVTDHVRARLKSAGADGISRRVLTVIPATDGGRCHKDDDGEYWRVYNFIDGARTCDTVESPEQAYQAARAFGAFQSMLVDLPGAVLHETIPDFHDGPRRMDRFREALEADALDRARGAAHEIDFAIEHVWIFDVLPKLVATGEIPVITTHNDTKINNVLLDNATGEGICVIDLDTVMPGLSLYDFGDLARTTISPATEDERDLSKIVIELPCFDAIARGYLATAGAFLSRVEREHMVLSAKMMTLIMGLRFLTDYLVGDTYYKTRREDHNLDRCRAQFALVRAIAQHEEQMNALVDKAWLDHAD
jgi:Ser/Thr protein kinase RdoA (MazF antagonist)